MTDQERTSAENDGYAHIFYVKGKGYCGIHRYLFTYGLAVNIHKQGDLWHHDYRYCYPIEHMPTLVNTLLTWSISKEEITTDPPDDKWVKKKGGGYDQRNPNWKD